VNAPQQYPPGWYQDPQGPGQRYWDGRQWTQHAQPAGPPQPAAQPRTGGGAPKALLAALGALVAIALVVGALLATGVLGGDDGGDGNLSQAEFKSQFEAIDGDTKQLGDDIQTTFSNAKGTSDAQLAAQLKPLVDRMDSVQKRLEELAFKAPTPDLENAVKEESGAAIRFGSDLNTFRVAAERHDESLAKTKVYALRVNGKELKDAANVVRSKLGLPTSP
jgi:hypothetical protein